ncbi:hypothetical protein GO613_12640 [Azoarcus communis]|uniref:phage tail terminator protein n=1 Tax=Parazoarcus communis TaxID=41977 RepID=UPI001459BFEF|nr:hypothetical protein [Parazoarcus communis]NMG48948.1 hypothetical protein [Parazoarcus communis]
MPGEWNFHQAEASIVAQLRACCQTGDGAWARDIGTRAALADTAEEMQSCPAIYVVYDGYGVLDADPQRAILAHRWLAVVAVANAVQGRESAHRTQEAGPFVGDVFRALHGFMPVGSVEAMVPATPPRPFYSPARFAYFPVAFTTIAHHNTRSGVATARASAVQAVPYPYP